MPINPERAYELSHTHYGENDLTDAEWETSLNFAQPYRKEVPHIDDFKESHPNDVERQRDKQVLRAKADTANMEKTERSIMLEALLAEHIEQSEWLGSNAYTFQTTDYDDLINHTDLVVEFEMSEGEQYLAIDVTTSGGESFQKKRDGIGREVKQGSLTMIKYFKSQVDFDTPEKVLRHIPRVAVSLQPDVIQHLASIQKNILERKPGANQEMANDPVQFDILKQIENQLTDDVIYCLRSFPDIESVPHDKKKEIQRLIEIVEHLPVADNGGIKDDDKEKITDLLGPVANDSADDATTSRKALSGYQTLKQLTRVRKTIQDIIAEKGETKSNA